MPILTFTTSNTQRGGIFNSRVLIGRRLSHGVVLEDPGVSRLHAWIDPIVEGSARWVLIDAGSKAGTYVNDQKITRHPLQEGDRIRVGETTLIYQEQETLAPGTVAVELTSPNGVVTAPGILFQCACGAPLWVGNDLAGKRGICRHCRQPVTVPQPSPAVVGGGRVAPVGDPAVAPVVAPVLTESPRAAVEETPVAADAKKLFKCAVCHSDIGPEEPQTQCPDCAMHFHAECWEENLGCSSYGCPQVNVLQPAGAEPVKAVVVEESVPSRQLPWEPILLAASVVGSAMGALTFGGLSAIVGIVAMVILIKGKAKRPVLLVVAVVVCVLGIALGLGFSDFWYFNAEHWPEALRDKIQ